MNYLKTYCNLIRKTEQRGYTKKKAKEQGLYVEGHHTFPMSIFGKNKRIVYLTARELIFLTPYWRGFVFNDMVRSIGKLKR